MPGSVASGTHCITSSTNHEDTACGIRILPLYCQFPDRNLCYVSLDICKLFAISKFILIYSMQSVNIFCDTLD